MISWIEILGFMAWPLLFCSLMMLALIVERCWFFLSLTGFSKTRQQTILALVKTRQWSVLQLELQASSSQASIGIKKMLDCCQQPINIIEDIASLWLLEQKTRLHANLAWLTLLAVISPLLGLLGTVLGMINAFQAMASHTGAISPALLANGLQQAMLTTAFGLAIAIPCLVSGHAFRIWANSYLLALEKLFNHILLSFQKVDLTDVNSPSIVNKDAPSLKAQQA